MTTAPTNAEVQYWNTQFDKCKNLRAPYDRDWYLNLAFYKGKQYVIWKEFTTGYALIEPKIPRHRVRLIANKIKPAIRTELTKLTKEEPQFYAKPATSDPKDVAAAEAAKILVEWAVDNTEYNKHRRRATFWAVICGTSFIRTTATNQNVGVESITPFHLYIPYIQEEDLEKQPYVIYAFGATTDALKKLYNVDVRPDSGTTGAHLEQQFVNALGVTNKSEGTNQALNDLVFVKEIWIKPCQRYPKGGLLVLADNKVIYSYKKPVRNTDGQIMVGPDGQPVTEMPLAEDMVSKAEDVQKSDWSETEYPLDHGMYPFDKISHIPNGSFYADSVIIDIISLQKEYNKTRSQIIEAKNRAGKPQITFTKGSVDPKKVTSEPGLWIPVNPGFDKPSPLDQAPVQPYVRENLDITLRDIDDSTLQNEISKGKVPPGIEAASAIAYLQEENDSRLYHTVASIEEATASVGRKLLMLMQQFWEDSQIVKVVSDTSMLEASIFSISDLKSNSDVRVEADSMAPRSMAAKQALITELMKLGVISPEQGLKYLNLNETNRLYEESQVDTKHARRENFMMSQGAQLTINLWDNKEVHLREHGMFMKSETFTLLPQEIQQVFLQHYQMHMQDMLGEILNAGAAGNPANGPADPNGAPAPGISA